MINEETQQTLCEDYRNILKTSEENDEEIVFDELKGNFTNLYCPLFLNIYSLFYIKIFYRFKKV